MSFISSRHRLDPFKSDRVANCQPAICLAVHLQEFSLSTSEREHTLSPKSYPI